MVLPLKWMPAYSHGGPFRPGQPTVVVVHCTESDNTPGMAEALMGPGWFGGAKAGTSTHKCVDVDSICEGVKRTTVAWHAGPGGNLRGIAYEFCGRVAWSAAKWREPKQLRMLRNAAPHIADDLRAMSAPARWLSLAQLGGGQRGLCTHNDIRLAFGGTTHHSDPGPNFPYAELLAYVQGDDMPSLDDIGRLVDEKLRPIYDTLTPGKEGVKYEGELHAMIRGYGERVERIDEGAHGGWGYGRRIEHTETMVAALTGQIAGLVEALQQTSAGGGQPVDLAAVQEAARRGTAEAITAIDVTVHADRGE